MWRDQLLAFSMTTVTVQVQELEVGIWYSSGIQAQRFGNKPGAGGGNKRAGPRPPQRPMSTMNWSSSLPQRWNSSQIGPRRPACPSCHKELNALERFDGAWDGHKTVGEEGGGQGSQKQLWHRTIQQQHNLTGQGQVGLRRRRVG